ncbi:MAG TPA: hypothetical protein VMW10_07020 [Alphaproteobacteria bacterium]|nr:hypothetical protein [Alphaproteobacteria bacterium]
MMNSKKEKPLIGTEGLIKDSHPLIDSAPRRSPQMDSFVQVGVPIREIVEGLLSQWNRGEI